MKLTALLFVSLLSSNFLLAQSRIDSLKQELEVKISKGNGNNIGSVLTSIGNEFLGNGIYDSALVYFNRALEVAKSNELKAAVFNSIGVAYNYKGYVDSSLVYYTRALDLYEVANDTTRSAILEVNISIIHKNRGLYDEALESAFHAISKLERKPGDRTLASAYNNIASVYQKVSDEANAVRYFRKALVIRKQIGFAKGVGQCYTNIAEVFIDLAMYDSALTNLLRAERIKSKDGNKNDLATTYSLLGLVYLELGDLNKSRGYLFQARDIMHQVGEKSQEAAVLNHLAKLRIKEGKLNEAEETLRLAERLINETHALDELRKNLELQLLLFKKMDRPNKAVVVSERLLAVKDSLVNVEKAESLLRMQTRYETEKKEKELGLLKQSALVQASELSARRNWILFLISVIALALAGGGVIAYQYRLLINKNRQIALLYKDMHHRIKNNFQMLASIFSLQHKFITDTSALDTIKSGESRIKAMALIHRMLYRDRSESTFNLKKFVVELIEFLSDTYGFRSGDVDAKVECEDIEVDVDKVIAIGLIINELVSNSMKHAVVDGSHLKLIIEIAKSREVLNITVGDNGVGVNMSDVRSKSADSFGLNMVEMLVSDLKGSLRMTTDTGTKHSLTIPI